MSVVAVNPVDSDPARPGAPTGTPRRVSQRRRWLMALAAVAAVGGWTAVDGYAQTHMFLINRSPSLPDWAFFVERGVMPTRGQVAFFAPPRGPLVQKHFGEHPSAFGKITYGLAGDRVDRRDGIVFITHADGSVSRIASLKPFSMQGEPLAPGPTGIIPRDCYYMGSPHKDGFDSRYAAIGWVCRPQIVGVATRVIL